MPKDLERDLGLYAVFTVSVGAMVGSGIFVLPGLAADIAGPSVILAYYLAGLLVLPAALSKAEMATAMPESGGTYLFIDRAMGPLPGTIAGVGAWFSLVFKSAFALVGLSAYLLVLVQLPPVVGKAVALLIAVALVGINLLGVKKTGSFQALIVTLVLAVLFFFIADGITFVQRQSYHPFFGNGWPGLVEATGFVFVSYAGVTKIASVAEEVEDPGRNIPIGVLSSVLVMMVVYTMVVFVVVGVTPTESLHGTLTPMADAAGDLLGNVGVEIMAVTAVLALTSMANAGVLSSSRYPFAMSRDSLAPEFLGRVHEGLRTPSTSILVTGAVLVFLIAFVPVRQLAKLASAFQILVFSLINLALVAFRESDLEPYDPDFVAPGYPWVQIAGVVGGVVLVTQMGLVPLVGALGILAGGALWYRYYARSRTERKGAAIDAVRRRTDTRVLDETRDAFGSEEEYSVLLALRQGMATEHEDALMRVATGVARHRDASVRVVRFDEVPDQMPLPYAAGEQSPEDLSFEMNTAETASELGVDVDVDEIVCHELNRAVVNFAEHEDIDLVIGEWRQGSDLLERDADWLMERMTCDVVFLHERVFGDIDEVALVTDRGPFKPLEALMADAIAQSEYASVHLLYSMDASATDAQEGSTEEYLEELADLFSVPVEFEIVNDDDYLVSRAGDSDLIVVGTSAHTILHDVLFGYLPDRLVATTDSNVLLVYSKKVREHTFIRYVLEKLVY